MYVHLGSDCIVACADIVAVINAASLTEDGAAEFVDQARAKGELRLLTQAAPLSYVVTTETVYASPVRPATLQRRVQQPLGYGA